MHFEYLTKRTIGHLGMAVGLALVLSACGGGSGGGTSTTPAPSAPKPNPVTVAPTTSCSAAGIAASTASTAPATVCMLTSKGEIVIALESVKAPITVANFLKYVNSKFYDNTIFHRVVPGFVVQGGGILSGYTTKPGALDPIKLESQNGLSNLRGTVAMARTSQPDSATNQFFFNTVDNKFLDYVPGVAGGEGYAVFGSVISGLATIDAIDKEPSFYINGVRYDSTETEVLLYWAVQLK